MDKGSNKIHFPNLDGFRFIIAMGVVIVHIESLKQAHNKETVSWILHYGFVASLCVTAFFVLSGFLITYLLLKEQFSTGTINLKNFYTRRILRIWPLYYFIIISGFFLLPHFDGLFGIKYSAVVYTHFWAKLIACLLFIPPYFLGFSRLPETMGTSWSVRVEELFYLCWPLLLKRVKKFMRLFVFIIIAVVLVRAGMFGLAYLINGWLPPLFKLAMRVMERTVFDYRFSCMAIGAMGAYILLTDKRKWLSIIYDKRTQIAVYLLIIALTIFNVRIPVIKAEVYSVLFCIIIMNLATNPNTIVRLDYKWTNYLGRISYGLYMYNSITRIFCLELVEHIYGRELSGWQMEVVLYVMCIISTIGLAALSYEFLEKPFLRLKNRYSVIKTE